jgi:endonuclease/exonuclease/phosphatase family metal-dependent hydrolase
MVAFVVLALFIVFSVSAALAESDKLNVRVMTRNMDAGTDFRYFVLEDFESALFDTVGEVLNSGIPQRAALLASEIAAKKPDLVALQEVTTWKFSGALLNQEDPIVLDQLAILMGALQGYGQSYRVAVEQELTTIDVAGLASFTDHDAILVRTDLPPGHLDVLGTETHLYDLKLPFLGYDLLRGWIAADVKIRGARFKFANTHLESAVDGVPETFALQAGQAFQLVTELKATNLPIILAGDFNSDAQPTHLYPSDATQSYGIVVASGFVDSWESLRPGDPGYTWPLFWEDPVSPIAGPIERIDLIFSKEPAATAVEKTGTVPDSSSGLYPSDHAGVLTTFSLENSRPEIKKK